MSVPQSKRSEGQLAVVTQANKLLVYTMRICSNEKSFPKRYRWCVTNRIVETTADITDKIIHANAIYIKDDDSAIERRNVLQKEALELTYVLLNQIQLAYDIFSIAHDRVEFWTKEVMELQRLLRGWNRAIAVKSPNVGNANNARLVNPDGSNNNNNANNSNGCAPDFNNSQHRVSES